MHIGKLKLVLLLSLILATINLSFADTIDTQLSRDKISLGDTFVIKYSLNNHSKNVNPDFSPLQKDFNILSTNYGNSINIVNGVANSQTFWQLTLEPKSAGELTIPEITIGDVKSTTQKLMVDGGSTQTNNTKNAPAFVQAEVSTSIPYVQSQVIYTFKLFYQTRLENPRIEIPTIENASLIQLGEGKNYQTTVNGKPYYVVEKSFAFFPEKTGKMTIPATHFRAVTYNISSNMFDNPFYVTTPRTLSMSTQAFNLTVRSIPEKFHGATWLPAKNIYLTEKWSVEPDHWDVENPVTRTIKIEAEGLRADQIPDLPIEQINGVNVYTSPPKRNNNIQGNTVIGTVEQQITYIPNTTQSFNIPEIKLNWWNIALNKNSSVQLNSLAIKPKGIVKNTSSMQANSEIVQTSKNETTLSIQDKTQPFYQLIWFWIAGLFFIIWLGTLGLIWKNRPKIAKKSSANSKQIKLSKEPSEKDFIQACRQSNAVLAKAFLLSLSKRYCNESSLQKLSQLINDELFTSALNKLDQAIYSNKPAVWNGNDMLSIYKSIQNKLKLLSKVNKKEKSHLDPLPSLYP